jgi:hypothetical protein
VSGGFYKRGCQVKTLYPSQGGFVFLGIQPLPGEIVPGKPTRNQAYSLEQDAYETESYFSQAIGFENIHSPSNGSDMTNGVLDMSKDFVLWNPSWANVDATTVDSRRSKGVNAAGRVAQAFDLAGMSGTAGAPSFAFFAKGGSRKCLLDWVGQAARSRNESSAQPLFTRTGPASSRE